MTKRLWVVKEPYDELRELIQPKSISREIDEYIKRRLSELQGREYGPPLLLADEPTGEIDTETAKKRENRKNRRRGKRRGRIEKNPVERHSVWLSECMSLSQIVMLILGSIDQMESREIG